MDAVATNAARIEELGGIIRVYSDLTEKLQSSHAQLQQTVQSLRNELSEKNRQLERRKRLAALGEMAAGMAHEIRNPLGGIELYASMLARDVAQQPQSLELVTKISSGVKRLEMLVSQVLQFSREIQPQMGRCDLAGLVDESLELTGDRLLGGVECRAAGPRPMPARIDSLLMGQAILNLVINAVEAVGERGMIDIAWSREDDDGHFRLSVRDSGPGIPASVLDRIFNPFFTTKETGTGLGLAIVHRIVEAHEGTIMAGNAPEGGAIFEIRI
jgi:two-component system sensor histidine kinase HydH